MTSDHPFLLAALWCVLPVVVGVVGGSVLKRLQMRPSVSRAALLLVPAAIAAALVATLDTLPIWDVVGLAAMTVASGYLAWRAPAWREWALGAVTVLLLCELLLRAVGFPGPMWPSPEEAHLTIPRETFDDVGPALFPDTWPDALTRPSSKPGRAARRVLHVGDSMVKGEEVAAELTFTALLDGLDAEAAHSNGGYKGTSADFHLAFLRRWPPRLDPTDVVLYVYAGNDLRELGRPYAACGYRAVLDWETLETTCAEPDWRVPVVARLARHPPPYPLRVATAGSAVARHLCSVFASATSWAFGSSFLLFSERAWDRERRVLEAIRDELDAADVRLHVVLLPRLIGKGGDDAPLQRRWLARLQAGDHARLVQLASELGLEAHDAEPFLAAAIDEHGPDRVFASDRKHFGELGHALMAGWLDQTVLPRAAP